MNQETLNLPSFLHLPILTATRILRMDQRTIAGPINIMTRTQQYCYRPSLFIIEYKHNRYMYNSTVTIYSGVYTEFCPFIRDEVRQNLKLASLHCSAVHVSIYLFINIPTYLSIYLPTYLSMLACTDYFCVQT